MIRFALLTAFCAALIGCPGEEAHTSDDGGGHAHVHEPKHGGELVELGDHEGFLEVKLDHGAGTCTVWLYQGEAMTDVKPGSPPVLNLKVGEEVKKLTAKDGGDGSWVFTDASLKGDPDSARFRIEMAGKTYTPNFVHHH